MQINQKGTGYKGTTAAERTSTLSCHHYAIIEILSINSPLMQHLCLRGFQACCFGEHAVVNMAVCGRTYERSSSGDGDILSVYQGELRGDCLSISWTVCDILDMTVRVCHKSMFTGKYHMPREKPLSYWISDRVHHAGRALPLHGASLLADTTLMTTLKVFYSCTQKQPVFQYDGIMAGPDGICGYFPHFLLWIWGKSAVFCRI